MSLFDFCYFKRKYGHTIKHCIPLTGQRFHASRTANREGLDGGGDPPRSCDREESVSVSGASCRTAADKPTLTEPTAYPVSSTS